MIADFNHAFNVGPRQPCKENVTVETVHAEPPNTGNLQ